MTLHQIAVAIAKHAERIDNQGVFDCDKELATIAVRLNHAKRLIDRIKQDLRRTHPELANN